MLEWFTATLTSLAGPILIGFIVLWFYQNYVQNYLPPVEEAAVRVQGGGKATTATVTLDGPKQRAVAILVADGWKRAAAVSALEHVRWRGYPEPAEMVLSAWESMPSYRT